MKLLSGAAFGQVTAALVASRMRRSSYRIKAGEPGLRSPMTAGQRALIWAVCFLLAIVIIATDKAFYLNLWN